jgi:imidazolonepropionase-like amidohydrolase
MNIKLIINILVLFVAFSSCEQTKKYDLAIKNATVFDSQSGTVLKNRTILINAGIIEDITSNQNRFSAKEIIEAKGKLVTPGFIDTHIHPTDVFGDYAAAPEYLAEDSSEFYRKKLSDTYLPYGVTTAMIMGQPENWLKSILNRSKNPSSNDIDIFTVGGALISKESREPYINHITVESPLAAKQKVLDYYNMGIRHIKLYWRLRKPEFEAAFKTADSLGMKVYGHIDQNVMFMETTLQIGLRNYEHLLTLDHSVINFQKEGNEFGLQMQKNYPTSNPGFAATRLEMFRFIHDKKQAKIDSLINKLVQNKVTFSTTIHLMAEQFGLTYFADKTDTTLTNVQLERCRENFRIFMAYGKELFDKGVKLRIGTDCPNGGKAIQSEQLLLFEYGFPVSAILQISTINGANALGIGNKYGSIEEGKKANLIIFDKSPFDNYRNFLSDKTVIKDGVIYKK